MNYIILDRCVVNCALKEELIKLMGYDDAKENVSLF